VLDAIAYARSTYPDHLIAMSVVADGFEAEKIEKQWAQYEVRTPLEIVNAPSGDFSDVTVKFIDEQERRYPNAMVTVVIPELHTDHWWQQLLHNQSVLLLKGRLLFRHNTAVTSIPWGNAEVLA
jgi:hypothetical protein